MLHVREVKRRGKQYTKRIRNCVLRERTRGRKGTTCAFSVSSMPSSKISFPFPFGGIRLEFWTIGQFEKLTEKIRRKVKYNRNESAQMDSSK